jgi:crotonobetainyl-CoA:carnitine CoA-transferase CaiB-like acyl-CoA transferase
MTARFVNGRVPAAPVLKLKDAIVQPHLRQRGTYRTIHDPILGEFVIPGLPFHSSEGEAPGSLIAPRLGQHTREVLEGLLGYDQVKLEELLANRLIACV